MGRSRWQESGWAGNKTSQFSSRSGSPWSDRHEPKRTSISEHAKHAQHAVHDRLEASGPDHRHSLPRVLPPSACSCHSGPNETGWSCRFEGVGHQADRGVGQVETNSRPTTSAAISYEANAGLIDVDPPPAPGKESQAEATRDTGRRRWRTMKERTGNL